MTPKSEHLGLDEDFLAGLWKEPDYHHRIVRLDSQPAMVALTAMGIVAGMPEAPPYRRNSARLDAIPHVDTPKPLSKRQRRRLRGKAKEMRP